MENFKQKIVFIDVDWTLYNHKKKKFEKSGIRALKKLHKKGTLIFLCTSRPYHSISYINGLKKIPNDGAILETGCTIYKDGKFNSKYFFTKKQVSLIKNVIEAEKISGIFVAENSAKRVGEITSDEIEYHRYFKEPIPNEYFDEKLSYTSALIYTKKDPEILKNCLDLEVFRFGEMVIGITPAPYNKGEGIARLLKELNIPKENAYAIGDDFNDISMFDNVGTSILMGSGKEELKEKVTYVTSSIDKNGIKKALKHFKLI